MIIQTIGTSYNHLPMEVVFAVLDTNVKDLSAEVFCEMPIDGVWGEAKSSYISEFNKEYIPEKIDCIWLSLYEETFYSVVKNISDNSKSIIEKYFKFYNNNSFKYIVGFGPLGYIALWLQTDLKCLLLLWEQGEKTNIVLEKTYPNNNLNEYLHKHCNEYIQLGKDAIVTHDAFQSACERMIARMQQYCLKYQIIEINASEVDLSELRVVVKNWDGSYDKSGDNSLFNFQKVGKPQVIAISYKLNRAMYSINVWFCEDILLELFKRFLGTHSDTKTEFIVTIDSLNNKYELSLYRQGLKEPVIIPESAYEMIVFKNKFEHYRSENYNQPRGAWIW